MSSILPDIIQRMETTKTGSVADEAYDKYVSTKIGDIVRYDEKSLKRFARTYSHYLRGWLPSDKGCPILDVGCGHGNMLYSLQAWGYTSVEGIDRSSEQVVLARKLYSKVLQGDAIEHLRTHQNSYDLILAIDLLEHFSLDLARQFLDASWASLRGRGRLILQLPNAGALRGGEPAWGDITHCRAYSAPAVKQFLKLSSFGGIEFRETGPVATGPVGLLRATLWALFRLCLRAYDMLETGRAASVHSRTMLATAVKMTND